MSEWRYCEVCEGALPSPWGMDFRNTLRGAMLREFQYNCDHCGAANDYSNDQDDFIDKLVDVFGPIWDISVPKEEE